jgi:hypothetical protein
MEMKLAGKGCAESDMTNVAKEYSGLDFLHHFTGKRPRSNHCRIAGGGIVWRSGA